MGVFLRPKLAEKAERMAIQAMKKIYISNYLNQGTKGHVNYDFADVAVNDDNLLFIDPVLLEIGQDAWCTKANEVVKSFFDMFYDAYKKKDRGKEKDILSHASEQNATHLGYGRGDNGKGTTAAGLLEIFLPIEELLQDIPAIERAEDLPLFIPNFAEDRMSDLLTNVLHEQLNNYTMQQLQKFGVESNARLSFWTWDSYNYCWKIVEKPSYCIGGKEVLLIPKHIVSRKYLFSTGQYFGRIILDHIRQDGGYMDDDKPISKKDILKSKRFSGKHWQYNETIQYTKENSGVLEEYHRKLPGFYFDSNRIMSDDDLDELIYGYAIVPSP